MKNNLTSAGVNRLNSPKIVFMGADFSTSEIKSTYSLLNQIRDLSPYNSIMSLTIEKAKRIFKCEIELRGPSFSTSLALESFEFESLLSELGTKIKEQLLEWKRSRF